MNALLFAAIVATMPNQTGGAVTLTDDWTNACPRAEHVAYARAETGHTTWGCWRVEEGLVHITWRFTSGRRVHNIYDLDRFTLRRPLPVGGSRA